MASASTSPFVGPMFEIMAGPDCKCFLVHASILTKSEKLKAVVEGDWKEREEQKVVLENWDEATVERLVSWLYTGDYISPYPTKFVHSTSADQAAMHEAHGGHGTTPVATPTVEHFPISASTYQRVLLDADKALSTSKEDPPKTLTNLAKRTYNSVTVKFCEPSTMNLDRWLRRCECVPNELDFEATLLAHAQVYALANYMLLADLQALAHQNLNCALTWMDSRIVAKSPTVGNLVTLIRYVFANTIRPNTGEEPLQKLLTTLVAMNFAYFDDGEEGQVRRLMNEGGDFASDVWEKVSRQMGALGKERTESHKRIVSLETEVQELKVKKRFPYGD